MSRKQQARLTCTLSFRRCRNPRTGWVDLPGITIPGFAGLYDSAAGGDNEQTYEGSDTITWAKGKHLIEGGFSYMRWKFTNYGLGDNGAFNFNGYYTSAGQSTSTNSNAFADFLLGDLSESNYAVLPVTATPTNNRFGFFITDDWKPTSKLTVNMGLRYDLDTLYQNSPGNMANFYPNLDELVTLQGTGRPDLFSGIPIVTGQALVLTPATTSEPIIRCFRRAWELPTVRSKAALVLRGGYGLYYVSIPWVWGSMQLARNAPYAAEEQYNAAAGLTPTLNFSDPFPTSGGTNTLAGNPSANALPTNYRYPATHQWNFTAESQITPNSSVRISYLGSESEHVTQQYNLNDPAMQPIPEGSRIRRSGLISLLARSPFGRMARQPTPSNCKSRRVATLLQGFRSRASLAGPRCSTMGHTPRVRGLRTIAMSALIAAMTLTCVPCTLWGTTLINCRLARGSASWGPPVARSMQLPADGKPAESSTIGSGLPYSLSFDTSLPGWQTGPNSSNYPDKVGNPQVSNPSLSRWFNPAAFAVPAEYTYGNAAPNSLFGPRYFDWDMGAFKTILAHREIQADVPVGSHERFESSELCQPEQ